MINTPGDGLAYRRVLDHLPPSQIPGRMCLDDSGQGLFFLPALEEARSDPAPVNLGEQEYAEDEVRGVGEDDAVAKRQAAPDASQVFYQRGEAALDIVKLDLNSPLQDANDVIPL